MILVILLISNDLLPHSTSARHCHDHRLDFVINYTGGTLLISISNIHSSTTTSHVIDLLRHFYITYHYLPLPITLYQSPFPSLCSLDTMIPYDNHSLANTLNSFSSILIVLTCQNLNPG